MQKIGRAALTIAAAVAAALASSIVPSSAQQQWPQRPVKFIVSLGPGSGIDIGTRLLADRLTKRWGQPVVVENRPGGDAMIAINAVIAANDDHVMLASPSSSFTAHPHIYKSLPYRPTDIPPVAKISNTIIAIAVPSTLEVKTLADLVAMARAKPGELNWSGTTGAIDFLFAGFLKNANLNMSKVPYRNPVEAINDLATGRIQVNETAYAIARPQVEAGKLKVLAVTNSKRAPTLPDVPTVSEAGFSDLKLDGLVGFFGGPDMPLSLRERIAADVRAVGSDDPIIVERMNLTGQLLDLSGPGEFQREIDEQRNRVAAAAKTLGITPTQ